MSERPVRVIEVKRRLDGRTSRFACALVLRRPHVVVLRYENKRTYRTAHTRIAAGSHTYGFFWKRRPYQLYRVVGPEGALIAHRFDVVEDVCLEERQVSYLDLLLDVWVDASGRAWVEDDDEVADYVRRGALTPAQHERIERTRALLLRRHGAIAREAERLLTEAGV